MWSSLVVWWQYYVLRGEKRVGARGRAFVSRKPSVKMVAKVKAKKYDAVSGRWEDIVITSVRVGKNNG